MNIIEPFLIKINDIILERSRPTAEHIEDNENDRAKQAAEAPDEYGNVGTGILDATVSPSNICYPRDFSLTNEAREKLEAMIDRLFEDRYII